MITSTEVKTDWRIAGEEVANCNCVWGCPCQFNALPTIGRCEALAAWDIRQGNYGEISLDGVRFARIFSWPGAVHDGNGTRKMVVDEAATAEQRAALESLESGEVGGNYFEIFATVCPNRLETVFAPIEFSVDRVRRVASLRIPGLADAQVEPIKNPATGEEHHARIVLPNGFEYKEAEMANTTSAKVIADSINFTLDNTYAQLNAFDWSNA